MLKLAKSKSVGHLYLDFIDTGRNSIAKDFLVEYGFLKSKINHRPLKLVNQEILFKQEGELYELSTIDTVPPNLEIYDGN